MGHNNNGMVTGLVFGALIGGAAALLFAPHSGKQNREMFKDRIETVKDKVQRRANGMRQDLQGVARQADKADYLH